MQSRCPQNTRQRTQYSGIHIPKIESLPESETRSSGIISEKHSSAPRPLLRKLWFCQVEQRASTGARLLQPSHRNLCAPYSLPIAAVTNYPNLVPEMTNLLSYNGGGQKSNIILTGWKSRCHQGYVPPGGSGGESASLPIPASRGCLHFLAPGFLPSSSKLATWHIQIFLSL